MVKSATKGRTATILVREPKLKSDMIYLYLKNLKSFSFIQVDNFWFSLGPLGLRFLRNLGERCHVPSSDFIGPNLAKHAHIELAACLEGEQEDSKYFWRNMQLIFLYKVVEDHLGKERSSYRNKVTNKTLIIIQKLLISYSNKN